MKKPLNKMLQAVTLCCTFSAVSAQDNNATIYHLDTTDPEYTKHYQLGGYKINGNSVQMKLPRKKARKIAFELLGSQYKYVSFSSSELGDPNREKCIFLPFNEETLDIKGGWFRDKTITVGNINLSLQGLIEERNCIALYKSKLGQEIKEALSPF